MRYSYQAVDRIPKQISPGVVYHSEEYEIGALLCACGCGHRVSLLVPDSHQITSMGGLATIHPSISVCDAPCKSHYLIRAGEVTLLPAFSSATAATTMQRQIARHARRDEKPVSVTRRSRVKAGISKAFRKFLSVFGL
jgi:hypothetical protein